MAPAAIPMLCNLSRTDRGARAVLGVGLLGAGVYVRGWWGLLSGLVGAGLLMNAAMGVCYLYKLLGVSTYKGK